MLIRTRDPNPEQRLHIAQRLRLATCEEVDCELWRNGRTFMVQLAPGHPATRARTTKNYDRETGLAVIHHPQGAPCGARCPNEYCPCVPAGGWPGAGGYPHHVPDESFDVLLGADGRRVGWSEFDDRTAEGIEALNHIRTRGL